MEENKEPFEGMNSGRLFNRKITTYSTIIVLLFGAIVLYRHWALDVPFGMVPEEEATEQVPVDSLQDTIKQSGQ